MFQRFTSLDALKGIGRDLLVRFLDPFAADLAARNIKLPDPSLTDTAYFHQAAAIFDTPGTLPNRLTITLAAFAEMVSERSRKPIEIVPANPSTGPPPRFALRKGLGLWELTFDYQPAGLNHEKGIFYAA